MKLSDFVPPILARVLKKKPKTFPNYETALAASGTYEDSDIVNMVVEKTWIHKNRISNGILNVQPTSALTFCALAYASLWSDIGIVDFGGGAGAHYFEVRSIIPQWCRLNWVVVDTPAMVKAAKLLETDELKFASELVAAKAHLPKVDIVHSSGAIQYTPNPEVSLRRLLALDARQVVLRRLALAEQTAVTVQRHKLSMNGHGPMPAGLVDRDMAYPLTTMARSTFKSIIQERYEVAATFGDEGVLLRRTLTDTPATDTKQATTKSLESVV